MNLQELQELEGQERGWGQNSFELWLPLPGTSLIWRFWSFQSSDCSVKMLSLASTKQLWLSILSGFTQTKPQSGWVQPNSSAVGGEKRSSGHGTSATYKVCLWLPVVVSTAPQTGWFTEASMRLQSAFGNYEIIHEPLLQIWSADDSWPCSCQTYSLVRLEQEARSCKQDPAKPREAKALKGCKFGVPDSSTSGCSISLHIFATGMICCVTWLHWSLSRSWELFNMAMNGYQVL